MTSPDSVPTTACTGHGIFFGVNSAILVTQSNHLPRALFLGSKLGIDVVGVDAAKRRYVGHAAFTVREFGAIQVAWWQVTVTHPRPKYLGKPETQLTKREGYYAAL